jgi:hypothetical protein
MSKEGRSFWCRWDGLHPTPPVRQCRLSIYLPHREKNDKEKGKGGSHYRCVSWGGGGTSSNDSKNGWSFFLFLFHAEDRVVARGPQQPIVFLEIASSARIGSGRIRIQQKTRIRIQQKTESGLSKKRESGFSNKRESSLKK